MSFHNLQSAINNLKYPLLQRSLGSYFIRAETTYVNHIHNRGLAN